VKTSNYDALQKHFVLSVGSKSQLQLLISQVPLLLQGSFPLVHVAGLPPRAEQVLPPSQQVAKAFVSKIVTALTTPVATNAYAKIIRDNAFIVNLLIKRNPNWSNTSVQNLRLHSLRPSFANPITKN
jgi:hypothetical protein